MSKLSLEELNGLGPEKFSEIFNNVIEHCPEAALACSNETPFKSVEDLCASFHQYLDNLNSDQKTQIMQNYPDLAGRLLAAHKLTKESTFEHSCAGLDQLSLENLMKLTDYNQRYRAKFNFPFVICVRQAKKIDIILSSVMVRIHNDLAEELRIGIEEVKKICELRILELVEGH